MGSRMKTALLKAMKRRPTQLPPQNGGLEKGLNPVLVQAAVEELAAEFGSTPEEKAEPYGHKLLSAILEAAGDLEKDVPVWMEQGYPLGIEVDLNSNTVFPETEDDTKAVEMSRTSNPHRAWRGGRSQELQILRGGWRPGRGGAGKDSLTGLCPVRLQLEKGGARSGSRSSSDQDGLHTEGEDGWQPQDEVDRRHAAKRHQRQDEDKAASGAAEGYGCGNILAAAQVFVPPAGAHITGRGLQRRLLHVQACAVGAQVRHSEGQNFKGLLHFKCGSVWASVWPPLVGPNCGGVHETCQCHDPTGSSSMLRRRSHHGIEWSRPFGTTSTCGPDMFVMAGPRVTACMVQAPDGKHCRLDWVPVGTPSKHLGGTACSGQVEEAEHGTSGNEAQERNDPSDTAKITGRSPGMGHVHHCLCSPLGEYGVGRSHRSGEQTASESSSEEELGFRQADQTSLGCVGTAHFQWGAPGHLPPHIQRASIYNTDRRLAMGVRVGFMGATGSRGLVGSRDSSRRSGLPSGYKGRSSLAERMGVHGHCAQCLYLPEVDSRHGHLAAGRQHGGSADHNELSIRKAGHGLTGGGTGSEITPVRCADCLWKAPQVYSKLLGRCIESPQCRQGAARSAQVSTQS